MRRGAFLILAVVNTKGGVGKTTLSVHLAGWFHQQGLRVAFIDTDEQASAAPWLATAAPQIAVFQYTAVNDLLGALREAPPWFDLIVVDAPAAHLARTAAILSTTDIALLPLQPTMLDVSATYRTARAIYRLHLDPRRSGRPTAGIVLNRATLRARTVQVARAVAESLGLPICPVVVDARVVFAEAVAEGKLVWELGARAARAAAEIAGVASWLADRHPALGEALRAARTKAALTEVVKQRTLFEAAVAPTSVAPPSPLVPTTCPVARGAADAPA